MKNKLLLGTHIPISDGKVKAFAKAESLGCTTMQIFTKSNRQWDSKPITLQEAELFQQTHKKSFVKDVIVHASYLINLGSSNNETREKSLNALNDELNRCNQLDLKYLVLHPGSSKSSIKDTIELISEGINQVFLQQNNNVVILLENMAGQGNSVGYKFEQLAEIYQNIKNKKRIGFCLDLCHAFASGYDFSTEDSYNKMWKEFDDILGISNLKAIHINDSKNSLGSKIDRHANIGKGLMGLEAFRLLINDQKLINIPKILETPIDKDISEYIANLKLIVNLISRENQEFLTNNPLNIYLD